MSAKLFDVKTNYIYLGINGNEIDDGGEVEGSCEMVGNPEMIGVCLMESMTKRIEVREMVLSAAVSYFLNTTPHDDWELNNWLDTLKDYLKRIHDGTLTGNKPFVIIKNV